MTPKGREIRLPSNPTHAEVIYEDGTKSVISLEDGLETALKGLAEHHRRAVNGEAAFAGDPDNQNIPRAVRVKRVLLYKEHPGNHGEDSILSTDEVKASLNDYFKAAGDVVNLFEVAAYIRDLGGAITPTEHPHDSQFRMQESNTLDASDFLDTDTGKFKGVSK